MATDAIVPRRRHVSNKVRRRQVWNVTGGYCWYCGSDLIECGMTIDHVVPRADGGPSTIDNLVPACAACNLEKGRKSLQEYRLSKSRKTFYGESSRCRRRLTR